MGLGEIRLGEMGLGEMGLGEMGLGEMGQNRDEMSGVNCQMLL